MNNFSHFSTANAPMPADHVQYVNRWTITTRLFGTDAEYHIARKEGSRVHTSKDISYLIKLCKERN